MSTEPIRTLYDLLPDEIDQLVARLGLPAYRARQILQPL